MDNIPISDMQLAYLNANLELVHEFLVHEDLGREYMDANRTMRKYCVRPFICLSVENWAPNTVRVAGVAGENLAGKQIHFCCDWCEMLQFVEDRDNAPPILK